MMLTPLSNDDALHLLTVHYGEAHRYYHDTSHLIDVMCLWQGYAKRGAWNHPIDAGLALAYHDAFYDPLGSVNEETSAAMGMTASKNYPADADRVRDMILATKRHLETFDTDEDTARVLDIDLAGLGRPWPVYNLNAYAIRLEFQDVSEEDWLRGRRGFLEKMLDKGTIYRLEPPQGSSEGRAWTNLQCELGDVTARMKVMRLKGD